MTDSKLPYSPQHINMCPCCFYFILLLSSYFLLVSCNNQSHQFLMYSSLPCWSHATTKVTNSSFIALYPVGIMRQSKSSIPHFCFLPCRYHATTNVNNSFHFQTSVCFSHYSVQFTLLGAYNNLTRLCLI